MIIAGFLGMTLKFTECTLGQKYRKIDEHGRVSGGPMHYLADGLREKGFGPLGAILATFFTICCIGGSLAGGNAFQVNQSLQVVQDKLSFLQDNSWIYGAVMAFFVGIVIIGGIRRIAQTAEKIVPAMCGIYVLACLFVIIVHYDHIPGVIGDIVGGAFSSKAVYGGTIGALITGFQRAAFSNEAGVGSAAIAHSAAKTEYPVREGIVALLEPFIDTIVVCSMTAIVINITDVYVPDGPYADLVAGKQGAALTNAAFAELPWMAGWFPYVLLVAVVLFAFSTMISWSYYGERCWCKLFGQRSSLIYKILFLVFVVLGSIVSATNVLEFGDLMILVMAFPNILGLYFLRGVVQNELREYEQKLSVRRHAGVQVSDPSRLVALADGLGVALDGDAAQRLCAYLDAILAENQQVNLTAVRDPEQALVLHVLDSLAIARADLEAPALAFDLGTGNGFPGVAVKALWPDTRVVLCDRTRKKLDAIDRALLVAGLDVDTIWLDAAQVRARAEEFVGTCDLVTARAVGEPDAVAPLARPLLRAGGRLVLWLAADAEAPRRIAGALAQVGIVDYELPAPAARQRKLAVYAR